jgi:FkbM family methyltransferase
MLKRRLLRALGHQRYLRFGVRDRVLRRLDDPDTNSPADFVVPFYGARYRGSFNSFIDWCAYYYGAYEREDLEVIADLMAAVEAPTFVDVGANVGHHTLFAATRARRVIAIEPFEPLTHRIQQKIDDNVLTNVTIVPCGLGDRDELVAYEPPTTQNTGTGRFRPGPRRGNETMLLLPVRRGDDVLADAGIERPSVIKIDTEGYERRVLAGLAQTLEAARPIVVFEWSPHTSDAAPHGRDLFPRDYTFYRRAPDGRILGVFRRPVFQLAKVSGKWPEANIFAIPNDFHARVRADSSASRAAARLGRA